MCIRDRIIGGEALLAEAHDVHLIGSAPLRELVGAELDEALTDHAVADDDLRSARVLFRRELLRALLAIVVDLQFVVWLTCFDDAALHDALLFTCCSLPFFGSAG